MASGHLDEEPASEAVVKALLAQHPELAAFLAQEPAVSRIWKIPYLGGISRDGATVYIDQSLPARLPITRIVPDKYIALHERFEWWVMIKLGLDYLGTKQDGGHPLAVRYEHDTLRADGYDPGDYEDELAQYIKEDESEGITPQNVPPDLFLGPYEDDQDALDRKLLPILRGAQR